MADGPKKVARAAMHRLEEAGIAALSAPSGNKNFYFLAKHAPDILESVLVTAEKSEGDERDLWFEILCNSSPLIWGANCQRYRLLEHLIPLALELEKSERPDIVAKTATALMRLTLRIFETQGVEIEYLRAALIVLHLKKAHWSYYRMKDAEIRALAPDIEFMSQHVDEVLTILPILKDRKTTEAGIVAALLSAKTPALSTGVL